MSIGFFRNKSNNNTFFSQGSMRAFSSRILSDIYERENGEILFITSELDFEHHELGRRYTIRIFTRGGNVGNISDYRQYETRKEVRKAFNCIVKFGVVNYIR